MTSQVVPGFENFLCLDRRIPHTKISPNANFQLPSPFSSKVINTWHFLINDVFVQGVVSFILLIFKYE